MVAPFDHTPHGLVLPAAASVPKSLAASLDLSDSLYAYSLPSPSSAAHSVTPSDHSPDGLVLPATASAVKSSPVWPSPGAGVANVTLTISSALPQPAALYAL